MRTIKTDTALSVSGKAVILLGDNFYLDFLALASAFGAIYIYR
jgi:hypothetical protein